MTKQLPNPLWTEASKDAEVRTSPEKAFYAGRNSLRAEAQAAVADAQRAVKDSNITVSTQNIMLQNIFEAVTADPVDIQKIRNVLGIELSKPEEEAPDGA